MMCRLLVLLSLALAGCQLPAVNLATQEPLKVDIAMKLDVYQHSEPTAAPAAADAPPPAGDAEQRRRNRMGEIQTLKNSRIVGESRQGLLDIRNLPPGEFGTYVERTVAAENSDRMELMQEMARQQNRPLAEIQRQQAELWRERSFEGEWIEVLQADGSFAWTQKGR